MADIKEVAIMREVTMVATVTGAVITAGRAMASDIAAVI